MDFSLRCNSLKCRTQLSERAVVTTCSHIFCIACSNDLGLSRPNAQIRICPACDTHLPNPDDAVETRLDPSEDYKTSVLSGLSPTVIMECAGRGLAFYSYQTTQEMFALEGFRLKEDANVTSMYQEFLAKSLTEKYSGLNSQMDKVVHDANTEIGNLRDKLQAVSLEKKRLEDENHKIAEAFREKARSQANLQKVYNQLKAQVLSGQVATAASEDAEATLQSVTAERFVDRVGGRPGPAGFYPGHDATSGMHSRQRSNGSGGDGEAIRPSQNSNAWPSQGHASRFLRQQAGANVTPSQHRTRLGETSVYNPTPGFRGAGIGGSQNTPAGRQPLSAIHPNTFAGPGAVGYGMSAGMRAGKQAPVGSSRGAWPSRVPGSRMG
ncbi:cyclin B1 interacting protein 1 [Phyllosticta capitalensis]|uniref:Cyclin B1 interacting protein 1 n=1 Tax=Phyllosticta capitalensis TaxID=121624 RepID=A0ABR1YXJ9_9PEZI